jgi:hypothetical protein
LIREMLSNAACDTLDFFPAIELGRDHNKLDLTLTHNPQTPDYRRQDR